MKKPPHRNRMNTSATIGRIGFIRFLSETSTHQPAAAVNRSSSSTISMPGRVVTSRS